jgi:hypothetical protein
MTYRTKTGKSIRKATQRTRGPRMKAKALSAAQLGPITWSIALLMVSVALAAAAVFTKKPF